ncbi:Ribosomal protein S18 acetylase RimI [Paenibacillus sp. UNC496MF]|uniref:GNAT family N-acetyltransferase n=1 Tax=Paenibacillus sp. UNC496MF TaxID=1502753 RepID=UPI0008F11E3B|nr:GNAT family protein [Paenibacillus sp. UNC496MF]SFI49824.1 Ribosomal protein S18 acetylase RimI [Paenibacillus sp. UNC496MF]
MEFRLADMNRAAAAEILGWRYEAPYDFYNNAPSEAAEEEMLAGGYAAVRGDGGELAGFLCLGAAARVPNGTYAYGGDWLDIGLGMKPELTGRGLGAPFFAAVLRFADELCGERPKRLTAAAFNRRAIRLYAKFGFRAAAEFEAGPVAFIAMVQDPGGADAAGSAP